MGCISSAPNKDAPATNHVDVQLAEAAAAERFHLKVSPGSASRAKSSAV